MSADGEATSAVGAEEAKAAEASPLLPEVSEASPSAHDGAAGAAGAAGGGEKGVGLGGYPLSALLMPYQAEVFEVDDVKHASRDSRLLWRKMSLVRNATRRFRYTIDLDGRKELELSPGLRFRVGASAVKAVNRFKSVLPRVASRDLQRVKAEGFGVSAKQLEELMASQSSEALEREHGGVSGLARLVASDPAKGIPGSPEDLERRKKIYGANEYPERPQKSFYNFVWDAMQDSTLWILAACAFASLLVGIITEGWEEGWYDGAGILFSILLVVGVTATSDFRQSVQFRLLDQEKKKVWMEVLRDGVRERVSVFDLVVGDVVFLTTGTIISTDGIFISGHSLVVDESSMTGESMPCYKGRESPFMLAGTKVQDGHGTMLTLGVGTHTEWGQLLAKLSDTRDDETPLQVKLSGVATLIGQVGLYVAGLVFLVLIVRLLVVTPIWHWGFPQILQVVDFFAVAVTIVVVAVPEGLPLAVTLSLAFAMKQMMADKALVRKLAACETMGSATTICSDKTGTLTTNQMTVVRVWLHSAVREVASGPVQLGVPQACLALLQEVVFSNTGGDVQVDPATGEPASIMASPTEAALLTFAARLGGRTFSQVQSSVEVLKLEPFNSQRKRMGVALRVPCGGGSGGGSIVRVNFKGAAEIIVGMCTSVLSPSGQVLPLKPTDMDPILASFTADALRTLAFAYAELRVSDLPPGVAQGKPWPEDVPLPTTGLTLLALFGIQDPLRPDVPGSVGLCRSAGIKVRMVTGDNLSTALAIAKGCGILTEGGEAIEGPVFRSMSDEERRKLVPKLQVMARSSPTDKHTLVSLLRSMGEVVAVTGDGTNDAPALKESDIGLAMGIAGTEVAKESADIVILDDNFGSIVNVAKWGRSVYTNIQKFVQFQLTVNIVALTTNFLAACFTGESPLTAVQLLWVNLIMDTLGALALATEPPTDALMKKQPTGRDAPFISNVMWRNVFGQAVFQLFLLMTLQFGAEPLFGFPHDPALLRTILFNTFVFCQVFNEINSREMEEINVLKDFFNNSIFLSILFFTSVFQVILVQGLSKFASTVPLTLPQFLFCVALGFLSMPVAALVKLLPVPKQQLSETIRSQLWSELSEPLLNGAQEV